MGFCLIHLIHRKFCLVFLEIQPPKNFSPRLNRCALGRHKFLCKKIFQIPNFTETLFSFGGRGERVSPCKRCPIQDRSNTMLRFHILSYISLVFNPNSQQYHMQNHWKKHNYKIDTVFILWNPQGEAKPGKAPYV